MAQTVQELIQKKRRGGEHTHAEIQQLIEGFTQGKIPEYQISAWLMAVLFQSMTRDEIFALTDCMLNSGVRLQSSEFQLQSSFRPVDKHSTGGVGDKTSLLIAPIVAACDIPVPMMAGRGLGHTGGTLDKLEALEGFRVKLSLEEFKRNIHNIGFSIIGQTEEICPADRKLYALRDVTATVESIPLIAASIMSKKIAEGIGALVLDVKFGSGAFMKTEADARSLALILQDIGTHYGIDVSVFLTRVDQPLGRFVGNFLEVGEVLSLLLNQPYLQHPPQHFQDTRELSLQIAAEMIRLAHSKSNSPSHLLDFHAARDKAEAALSSGKAMQKFKQLVEAQGGELPDQMPHSRDDIMCRYHADVVAQESGFVHDLDTEAIGWIAVQLGAGRQKVEDQIDPWAGIEVHVQLGEAVKKGDRLYTIYSSKDPETLRICAARLQMATNISLQKPELLSFIAGKIIAPQATTTNSNEGVMKRVSVL